MYRETATKCYEKSLNWHLWCIQRRNQLLSPAELVLVSIPFKRESVFRVHICERNESRNWCFNSLQTGKWIQSIRGNKCKRKDVSFNSLQTGKCIQSHDQNQSFWDDRCVSIPFKREVYSEKSDKTRLFQNLIAFQFPSNGKVYSERVYNSAGRDLAPVVSIPFKRESGFRVTTTQRAC